MLHYRFILACIGVLLIFGSAGNAQTARQVNVASITGTWTGQSICAAARPACKNEVVVYRFEPAAGRPQLVTLFADKIVNGKRVPMYKLDFEYDEGRRTLSGEFEKGRTRSVWEYRINGDTIEGTGIVLSGKSAARQVKVRRVKENQVPRAPDRGSYDMN